MQLQEDLTGHQADRSFRVSDFLLHRHITSIRKLFSEGKKKKKKKPQTEIGMFQQIKKFTQNCRPEVLFHRKSHVDLQCPSLWLSKHCSVGLEAQSAQAGLLIAKTSGPGAYENFHSRKT